MIGLNPRAFASDWAAAADGGQPLAGARADPPPGGQRMVKWELGGERPRRERATSGAILSRNKRS